MSKAKNSLEAKDASILVSNIIEIRTVDTLLPTESIGAEVPKIRRIGGCITKTAPLTFAENEALLPELIKVSPTSPTWEKSVSDYFNDISVQVPEDGKKLEIGFKYLTDEDRAAGEAAPITDRTQYGYPINVADYVLYRYCLVYGRVANDYNDIHKSPKIRFYIYDPQLEVKTLRQRTQVRQTAYAHYLNISNDLTTMKNILEVQGNVNVANDLVATTVEEFAVNDPESYLRIVNDKRLSMKAFIQRALYAGVLSRMDNTEVIYFDEERLGSNYNEVSDKISSQEMLLDKIKAKLDNAVLPKSAAVKSQALSNEAIERKLSEQLEKANTQATEVVLTAQQQADAILEEARREAEKIRQAAAQAKTPDVVTPPTTEAQPLVDNKTKK